MRFRHEAEPGDAAAPAAAPAQGPLVAVGLGGRLELGDGGIRFVRGGLVGHLAALLWLSHGMMEKHIPLSQVTSVEVVTPVFLPNFVRLTYAGSPPQTGRYLADSLAENALLMNLVDNRAFYEIVRRIERDIAPPVRGGTAAT